MAKYVGFMPVRGSLGNLTFYRAEDGEIHVKPKSGLDRDRLMRDPAFQGSRETMSEFGKASKAAQFFLQTFREAVTHKPDRGIMGRLQKTFRQVIESDQGHVRGKRTVHAGDLNFFRGFEFNKKSPLSNVFWGNFTGSIDRATGACRIEIPSYDPEELVQAPEDATHYRFVAGAVGVDFTDHTFIRQKAVSDHLPLRKMTTVPFTLDCDVQPNSTMPLFLALGVEYFKEQCGRMYPLRAGKYNAISIIKTDV